jgi:hypothetical protein
MVSRFELAMVIAVQSATGTAVLRERLFVL